ncbi:MAG: FecR domain-containing protein [Pyrinomonadaceae bacterium]
MSNRSSRFVFDWWVVQKRLVYMTIAFFVLCGVAGGAAVYVWKFGNPFRNAGMDPNFTAGARFISFEGDVRVVRAATREIISAGPDTELYPGDTVQTQANGRARISLADGSTLVVRPNSTIIVRDNAGGENGKRSNVHVVVDSGQLYVRTEQQPEGATNVVETPKTKNKIGEQTGASFGVNPEGTEEIRVNTGVIETTNRSGDKTSLHGGEYASVNPSGTIFRQKLLEVPLPAEPRDLERVYVNANGSAGVPLKWLRPQSGTAVYYRVEVATSPFFVTDGKVIERDQLAATEFTASDLRPGVYFWRVRATAATGQTSDWTEPQKFIIATHGTGSQVPVSNLTAELLGGNIYLVRGHADPGTIIHVLGREAIVPTDGSFQVQITAAIDAREVLVDAQDSQGNSSQYKLVLSARGGRGRG